MPPAIQRRMRESAVGGGAAARTNSGSEPISEASVAAAVALLPIKPRRLIFLAMTDSSAVRLVSESLRIAIPLTNELKLGAHDHGPKQIGQARRAGAAGMGGVSQCGDADGTFRGQGGAGE